MKELNRRQFFNLIITGAAGFVGVTAASAAKKTFDSVHEFKDAASVLSGSIPNNWESTPISANAGPDSDLLLAQFGSVRRSCRRTARRTARRTSRRVNRRQERRDDD